jgi:adenylosuccinate lyase
MPHKVNPIDFENSEGNIGIANALLHHLAQKLPVSRWQRDLSDSTALRNMGVALGHTLLAWDNCAMGLSKIEADANRMRADLDSQLGSAGRADSNGHAPLRRAGAYEQLKTLTRGKTQITREALHAFHCAILRFRRRRETAAAAGHPWTYLGLALASHKSSEQSCLIPRIAPRCCKQSGDARAMSEISDHRTDSRLSINSSSKARGRHRS